MQTYGNPDVTYGWWAGNSRVTNRAGKFIAAHAGHTGLISFAAGASTLWELARFDPSIAMGHQSSIFLAHLASIGIGYYYSLVLNQGSPFSKDLLMIMLHFY